MSNPVIIWRSRLNVIQVDLGEDVSADTFTSEIRTEPDTNSQLLAEFDVDFVTDGTDGKLTLTLSALDAGQITVDSGWTDIKRVSGADPVPVFEPLEVSIRGVVTL
jgi:hypothetical protein